MKPTRARAARRAAALGLLLAALATWLFFDHLRGVATFPHDFPMTYYATTAYWIASVQAGEWPHWVPYQSMGQPFVALPQTGVFYPPLWALAALRLDYTIRAAAVVQVLHILVGAAGCVALARTQFRRPLTLALAGASFLLFGGLYTNAQHPDIVRAFTLVPWVLWTLTIRPGARLGRANLLSPLALALFISGGYPGLVIAGLPLFAVYLVAQAVRDRAVAGRRADLARQAALLGLGVALAGAYLVPTAAAAPLLVRTRGAEAAGKVMTYLSAGDLLELLFSSRAVHVVRPPAGADPSMCGMQLPIVLVPFLAFVRRRDLRALAPLLVVAAWAVVMAFDELSALSSIIVRLVPPLGWSRFPGGDHRLFFALPALLVALAGVEAFAARRRRLPRLRLRGAAGLALLVVLLGALAAVVAPPGARGAFVEALAVQAVALGGVTTIMGLRRGPRLDPAIVALAVVAAVPVIADLAFLWRAPESSLQQLYDARGVPLRAGDRLAVAGVFERELALRPRRSAGVRDGDLAIRGWVDGSFMLLDYGGGVTRARSRIMADPALVSFMREPGRLAPLDPREGDDVDVDPATLAATGAPGFAHAPVRYARNEVAYEVRTDRPRLVVENEVFAPGWTGTLEPSGATLEPVRVNGALRAWRVPPGDHVLRLRYTTPGLGAGAALSAAALVAWALFARLSRTAPRPGPPARPSAAAPPPPPPPRA